jgi:hypothetical protein
MKRKLSKASSSTGLGKTSMIAVAFSMPPTKAKELRSLFQQIDKDGSGQVDQEEFRAALAVSNPEMSPAAVDALFSAIDQDGNQHISFLEFVAAMLDPKEVDIAEINQVPAYLSRLPFDVSVSLSLLLSASIGIQALGCGGERLHHLR